MNERKKERKRERERERLCECVSTSIHVYNKLYVVCALLCDVVVICRCLCNLGLKIGFTPEAISHYVGQQQIVVSTSRVSLHVIAQYCTQLLSLIFIFGLTLSVRARSSWMKVLPGSRNDILAKLTYCIHLQSQLCPKVISVSFFFIILNEQ